MNEADAADIAEHLLEIYGVNDASAHKLPWLQSIKLELHIYCWEEVLLTRFKLTKKKDRLWVDWHDAKCEFHHRFAGFDGYQQGYIPESD